MRLTKLKHSNKSGGYPMSFREMEKLYGAGIPLYFTNTNYLSPYIITGA